MREESRERPVQCCCSAARHFAEHLGRDAVEDIVLVVGWYMPAL
jgi:hypothetical protein